MKNSEKQEEQGSKEETGMSHCIALHWEDRGRIQWEETGKGD